MSLPTHNITLIGAENVKKIQSLPSQAAGGGKFQGKYQPTDFKFEITLTKVTTSIGLSECRGTLILV